jgi:hypothetical protein
VPLVLVLIAVVALIAAIAFAAVRVAGAALGLRRAARVSHNARLEALYALDHAREQLAAAVAHTGEQRASLDAQVAELGRARASLGLLVEAAGEALRVVRIPR